MLWVYSWTLDLLTQERERDTHTHTHTNKHTDFAWKPHKSMSDPH